MALKEKTMFTYLPKGKTRLLLLGLVFLALLGIVWIPASLAPQDSVDHTLTLLHTNDTHSSYGGVTDKGMVCYAALCPGGKGGYVRLEQAVRAVREDRPEALFLDAGDIFQGTLFWVQHRERMPAALVDKMGYQAIIPGNHEFDDGPEVYLRMVNALQTPVLSANTRFETNLLAAGGHKIRASLIVDNNGRKIGIIGIANPDTPFLSSPGPSVHFGAWLQGQPEGQQSSPQDGQIPDLGASLREAVAGLEAKGVNIIVALTHLGLGKDRELARAVDGLDVIVGGHSHSLLANSPDLQKKAEGPYPVVEKSPNGNPVLVVTASTACLYLGRLEAGFDKAGVVRTWQGEPIPLDEATLLAMDAPGPDPALVRLIDDFAVPVAEMMGLSLGTIRNRLPATTEGQLLEPQDVRDCRMRECLTGNVVTDAIRAMAFDGNQIVVLNGGALRHSLPGGTVTMGDVLGTLPFNNVLMRTRMQGSMLLQVLEHGVSAHEEGEGRFLQVSGLRYAFDPARQAGQRVTMAEVQTQGPDGLDDGWRPVQPDALYPVVTIDYLVGGGDDFTMLKGLVWQEATIDSDEALRLQLERHSPIEVGLEGRITVLP